LGAVLDYGGALPPQRHACAANPGCSLKPSRNGAAGIAFRHAVKWSVPMQCGLLRLNRILRDRPGPDRRGRSEPGAPVRGRRERRAPEPLASGQKAERDSGWIVAVDNFS
jgi:hypothetical protein